MKRFGPPRISPISPAVFAVDTLTGLSTNSQLPKILLLLANESVKVALRADFMVLSYLPDLLRKKNTNFYSKCSNQIGMYSDVLKQNVFHIR